MNLALMEKNTLKCDTVLGSVMVFMLGDSEMLSNTNVRLLRTDVCVIKL